MSVDTWTSAHLLRSPLFGPLALVVDSAEVGDDDGHRQGDDQHAAQRADGAEDLPHDGLWHHVAVPEESTDSQNPNVFMVKEENRPGSSIQKSI